MKRAGLFDVEYRRQKLLATRDFLDRVMGTRTMRMSTGRTSLFTATW